MNQQDVIAIFDEFIKALQKYEEAFRKDLQSHLITNTNYNVLLIDFPKFLYNVLKHGFNNNMNDKQLINMFNNMNNAKKEVYVEQDKQIYKDTVYGYIQDTARKVLNPSDTMKSMDLGYVFEGLGGLILQNMDQMINDKDTPDQIVIKTFIKNNLVGLNGLQGDAKIKISNDLFKTNKLFSDYYIDFKWSTDLSQAIKGLQGSFVNKDSTPALAQEILSYIRKSLNDTVLYDKNDKFSTLYDITDVNNSPILKDKKIALYKIPKRLIFLFKDNGYWASEVYDKIKEQVSKNAVAIYNRNSTFVGSKNTQSYIWYAQLRNLGGKKE